MWPVWLVRESARSFDRANPRRDPNEAIFNLCERAGK